MTFEESLSKLEEISAKLNSGDCTLDESIALYEQAMVLSRQCTVLLENAKLKIKELNEIEKADEN